MRKLLSSVFAVLVSTVFAELRFDVANPEFERVQEPVLVKLTKSQLDEAHKCALYELGSTGRKTPVPFCIAELNDAAYISWVMDGVTEAGAIRTFIMEPGERRLYFWPEHSSDLNPDGRDDYSVTDLSVMDDKDKITIGNQFYTVSQRKRGGGSLPQGVKFNLSGNSDPDLGLYERIARPDVAGLFNDPESTARLLYSSPLLAIVETNAKYRVSSQKEEKGNPRARYRFFFSGFTPVVRAEIVAEHESDEGWKEIHFLHLTHIKKERFYERNVMGAPAKSYDYLKVGEKSVSHVGADWGVMERGGDAVGVGGGRVVSWDAANEFFYYVRLMNIERFHEKRLATEGLLYFGQAQEDSSMYSKWLRSKDLPKVSIRDGKPAEQVALKPMLAPHIFTVGSQRIAFAGAEKGFGLVGLEAADGKPLRFMEIEDKAAMPLWKAEFRAGTDAATAVRLTSQSANGIIRQNGGGIVMEWKGMSLGEGAGTVDVTATVEPDGDASDWRIAIKTDSARYGLWESEYPVVGKVFDAKEGSTLLPTGNWGGTLRHNVPCSYSGTYPSTGMPVQFAAFMKQGRGLYFGIHDGLAMHKFLNLSISQSLAVRLPAEAMGVPGSGREDLFPVKMKLFDGDWWTAAKIYREWAAKQKWTSRGRTFDNPKFPKSLADVSFWMEIGAAPEAMEKYMIPLAEKAGFPIGVHWYNWNVHKFDTHYPNMLPAKEKMAEATKRMREHGIVVMPYINGRIWDTTIDDYKTAIPWTCKDEYGKPYMEVYPSSYIELATMCPYTQFYQKAIRDVSMDLFEKKLINSLYLDQIGAARPRLCFDKSHGHPVGGGRFWTEGYRELLKPLRKYVDEHGFSLTTENTSEPYMDSIDSFLAWNQREDTDVPLLPAVYSGYTTYFSTPTKALKDFGLSVRTQHGRDFLWGDVVGWNPQWILDAKHAEDLEFDLMLGAHRYATRDFMAHGELIGEIHPTENVPLFNVTWFNRSPHDATMPNVQGTVWEAMDGRRCAYILNYIDGVQKFSFNLPVPSNDGEWLVRRVTPKGSAPLAIVSDDLSQTLQMKPKELVVLTIEKYDGNVGRLVEEAKAAFADSKDETLANSASQFLFSCDSNVRVTVDSQIEWVSGQSATLRYKIENKGPETEIDITWPNRTMVVKKLKANNTSWQSASIDNLGGLVDNRGYGTVAVGNGKARYTIPVEIRQLQPVSAELRLPKNVFAGEATHATLIVSNNSSDKKDVTLLIRAPESWKILPSRNISIQNLMGRSKRCLNLLCELGEQQEDSTDRVDVVVQYDIGGATVPVLRTRPKVIAHAANINIDGNLGDWTQADTVVIDESSTDSICYKRKGFEYGGSSDCSVRARAAWDNTNLYFAFEVTDDIHVNPNRDTTVWKGDMLQIELRPGGPAEKSNDTTARQFGFGCDDEGPFMFQWNKLANDGTSEGDGVQKNCRIACVKGENGSIVYEAAVPWRAIQLEAPKPDARFGFSFVVSDNDDKDMKGWLELTPGIFGSHNPAAYGWLLLKK